MKTYEKVIAQYFKSIKYFNEFESTPRDFGTNDLLFKSEIHTIITIGKNPGINLTELASALDITMAGASKFVKKLVDKELVIKSRLANNKKEVIFNLTQNGELAYKGHKLYSNKVFGEIYQFMSEMENDDLEMIEEFLKRLNHIVTKGIEQNE